MPWPPFRLLLLLAAVAAATSAHAQQLCSVRSGYASDLGSLPTYAAYPADDAYRFAILNAAAEAANRFSSVDAVNITALRVRAIGNLTLHLWRADGTLEREIADTGGSSSTAWRTIPLTPPWEVPAYADYSVGVQNTAGLYYYLDRFHLNGGLRVLDAYVTTDGGFPTQLQTGAFYPGSEGFWAIDVVSTVCQAETLVAAPAIALRQTLKIGRVLYGPGLCGLTSNCTQDAAGYWTGLAAGVCRIGAEGVSECQLLAGSNATCFGPGARCQCNSPCLGGATCTEFARQPYAYGIDGTGRYGSCLPDNPFFGDNVPLCAAWGAAGCNSTELVCVRQTYGGLREVKPGVRAPASDVCCPRGYRGDSCDTPVGCSLGDCLHGGSCLVADTAGNALRPGDTRCFGCDPGWGGAFCHLALQSTFTERNVTAVVSRRRLLATTTELVRTSYARASPAAGLIYAEPARVCDCAVAWRQLDLGTEAVPTTAPLLLLGNYARTIAPERVLLTTVGFGRDDDRAPTYFRYVGSRAEARYLCYRDAYCGGFHLLPKPAGGVNAAAVARAIFFSALPSVAGAETLGDASFTELAANVIEVHVLARGFDNACNGTNAAVGFDPAYYAARYPAQTHSLLNATIGNFHVADLTTAAQLHWRLFGHQVRNAPHASCNSSVYSRYAEDEQGCANLLQTSLAVAYDPNVGAVCNATVSVARVWGGGAFTGSVGAPVIDDDGTVCQCAPPFASSSLARTDCAIDRCGATTTRGFVNNATANATGVDACVCVDAWNTDPSSCDPVTGVCNWCATTECQNNGTTLDGRCACNDIFTGPRCETSLCNETNTYPWRSTFLANVSTPIVCDCLPGWTGKFCDVPACVFGDWSYANASCVCSPGYSGADCSVSICAQPQGYWNTNTSACACYPPWTPASNCFNHTCNPDRSQLKPGWNGVYPFGNATKDAGLSWRCDCNFPYANSDDSKPYDCRGSRCGQYGQPTEHFNASVTSVYVNGTLLTSTTGSSFLKCDCVASSMQIFTRPENCVDDDHCRPCSDAVCKLPYVVWPKDGPQYGYATVAASGPENCNCPVPYNASGSTDGVGCRIYVPCNLDGTNRTHVVYDRYGTGQCDCANGYTDLVTIGVTERCVVPPPLPTVGSFDGNAYECERDPTLEFCPHESTKTAISGATLYGIVATAGFIGIVSIAAVVWNPVTASVSATSSTTGTIISKKPVGGRVRLADRRALLPKARASSTTRSSLYLSLLLLLTLSVTITVATWNQGDISCFDQLPLSTDASSFHDTNCCGNGVWGDLNGQMRCVCNRGFDNLGGYAQCCINPRFYENNTTIPKSVTDFSVCCPVGETICMSKRQHPDTNGNTYQCDPVSRGDCGSVGPPGSNFPYGYDILIDNAHTRRSCTSLSMANECRIDNSTAPATRLKCQCTERYGGDHCELDSCTGMPPTDPELFPPISSVTTQCAGHGGFIDVLHPVGCNNVFANSLCTCLDGFGLRSGAWDDASLDKRKFGLCVERTRHTNGGLACGGYGTPTYGDLIATQNVGGRFQTKIAENRVLSCDCPDGTTVTESGLCQRYCPIGAGGQQCGAARKLPDGTASGAYNAQGTCMTLFDGFNSACSCNLGWNGPSCSLKDPNLFDAAGTLCPWGRADGVTRIQVLDDQGNVNLTLAGATEVVDYFTSVTAALNGSDILGPLADRSHSRFHCACDTDFLAKNYSINPLTGLCHRGCDSAPLMGTNGLSCSGHGACVLDPHTKNDYVCHCESGYNETNCGRESLRDRQGALCGGPTHGVIHVDYERDPSVGPSQWCECLPPYHNDSVTALCHLPLELGCPISPFNGERCGGDTSGHCDRNADTGNDFECVCRRDGPVGGFLGRDCSQPRVAVYQTQSGARVVCTGHGTPDELDSGACICLDGYVGYACEIYVGNRQCGSTGQSYLDTEAAGIVVYQALATTPTLRVALHGLFDIDLYLIANPDVAAVYGANGFSHYATYGYAEGREVWVSSGAHGQFDSAAYVAANPDLASAGYDAMTAYAHYLTYGYFEGRDAWVHSSTI